MPYPHGENHYAAKLTLGDVTAIRRMREDGKKLCEIADHFSVTEAHISLICSGQRWNKRPATASEGL